MIKIIRLSIMVSLFFVAQSIFSKQEKQPDITEFHINLSNKTIWLDPIIYKHNHKILIELYKKAVLPTKTRIQFAKVIRWVSKDTVEEIKQMYNGSRLSKNFKNMRVYFNKPGTVKPNIILVEQPTVYPDFSNIVKTFKNAKYDYPSVAKVYKNSTESNFIAYMYFYYNDRVEVVPTLYLSGLAAQILVSNHYPKKSVYFSNLTKNAIARLEINGQTIFLGETALKPEVNDKRFSCSIRNFGTILLSEINKPMKVRWQFSEASPRWHNAIVKVPHFKSKQKIAGRVTSTNVIIYFQKNDVLVAEREQEIEISKDKSAIRFTGPSVPLSNKPPCGKQHDRWTLNVKRIKD